MKCVIAFACLLAVASAGYINAPLVSAPLAYAAFEEDGSYKGEGLYESAYKGEGLLESLDHNSPVADARSTHAVAYNAPLVSAPHPVRVAHTYAGHYAHAYAAPIVYAAYEEDGSYKGEGLYESAYKGEGLLESLDHNSPVADARSTHAVAYNAPLVSAPHPIRVPHTYAGHYAHAYAAPIVHSAYAHALPLATEARLVDPVAIAAGAPLPTGDNIDVAAAKAFHHAAHHEAKKAHLLAKGHVIAKRSPGFLSTAPIHSYGYSTIAAPLAYSAYNTYGYGRFGSYYL